MKANKKPKVAIVIPAYNEAAVIGDVIKSVKQKIKKENFEIKIVVVDDGSTDETAKISKKRNVVVISHILNSLLDRFDNLDSLYC